MSWLDESIKKEQYRQRKIETEREKSEKIRQKKKTEYERLTSMVKQLLSDMGERYFGSFLSIKKYKIEDIFKEASWRYGYSGYNEWYWRCMFKDIFHNRISPDLRSWKVELKFTSEGVASHFVVGGESTPDTSQSELKKLLVKDFEIGPH